MSRNYLINDEQNDGEMKFGEGDLSITNKCGHPSTTACDVGGNGRSCHPVPPPTGLLKSLCLAPGPLVRPGRC